MRRVKVLMDTNFLLLPFNEGVNIISELDRVLEVSYELLVPSFCIEELRRLSTRGAKYQRMYSLAMQIIDRHCRIIEEELKPDEKVDDALIRLAKKLGAVVATGDAELRRKLRLEGIPIIYLRCGKKLEVEGLTV